MTQLSFLRCSWKLFFSLTSRKLTMFPCQYFHDVSPLGPIEPVIFHDIKCKTGKFLHLFLIFPPLHSPRCVILSYPVGGMWGTLGQSDRHILTLSHCLTVSLSAMSGHSVLQTSHNKSRRWLVRNV